MKILVCDDHRLMRDGLKVILERAALDVVGEAENGRRSIELALELRPDVVVMDISMPELNGMDATRLLLERWPEAKVIALSMNADRRYVMGMFAAGAVGYLIKNAACKELIHSVQAVASGLKYVSPAIAGPFIDDCLAQADSGTMIGSRPAQADVGTSRGLSPREREVLQLLAEGKSSKGIAALLAIAPTTVESHRRQIMDKLGIRSIAGLTKYAVREGLTSLA
jgi:NarL family two-component system response regulator LiaR